MKKKGKEFAPLSHAKNLYVLIRGYECLDLQKPLIFFLFFPFLSLFSFFAI